MNGGRNSAQRYIWNLGTPPCPNFVIHVWSYPLTSWAGLYGGLVYGEMMYGEMVYGVRYVGSLLMALTLNPCNPYDSERRIE